MRRVLAVVRAVFPLVLFLAALWVLQRELRGTDWSEVLGYLRNLPLTNLLWAFGVTVVSYFVLTLYDYAGTQYAREPLPYSTVAPASFVAYAFTNALGHPLLTGTPIRVRFYTVAGISGLGIARIVTFCFVGFWVGFGALGGLSLSIAPEGVLNHLPLNNLVLRVAGAVLVVVTLAYMAGSAFVRRTLSFRGWEFHLPSFRQATMQLAISVADWILAAMVPFLLLPHDRGEVSFFYIMTVFLIAHVAGLLSQVPGGIGVFETIVLVSLGGALPRPTILGALVIYRVVYYLVPLVAAIAVLAWTEFEQHRHHLTKGAETLGEIAPEFVPGAFGVAAFAAGAILLVTGATPQHPRDLEIVSRWLPLGVIELAHFVASLAGVWLLIIARGLQHRLSRALRLGTILFAIGIVTSILRGIDWGSALLLAVLLASIWAVSEEFYRKARMSEARFTPGWSVSVLMVFAATVWLTFFAHKHVTFTNDLWLHFTLDGTAARALRALIGVSMLSAVVSFSLLLNPRARVPSMPDDEDMTDVERIVRHSSRAISHLALIRDKRILFHPSHEGFVMFRIERRSWVSFGDPVAAPEEADELAWAFRDLAVRQGGWPVFYQVREDSLRRYLDMGLAVVALGEEARVDLSRFDPDRSQHDELRSALAAFDRDGLEIEIVESTELGQVLTSMRNVSNRWFEARREGSSEAPTEYFSAPYLRFGPVALVTKGDEVAGFANLWRSGGSEEIMVDLARLAPEIRDEALLGLFAKLMLWANEQGVRWFNLGLAPPRGADPRRRSALWNEAANVLYRHGEHFPEWAGLREFKEAFDPVWEPRYLASPGGLLLPMVFRDLARLVSRSLRGSLGRGIQKPRR
jgi:phosphatidylglycerol lysyltransferase